MHMFDGDFEMFKALLSSIPKELQPSANEGMVIMKGYEVVQAETVLEWLEANDNKVVARDVVGPSRISTIFLGHNHGDCIGDNRKLYFETKVWGPFRGREWYATLTDALVGHAQTVERIRAKQTKWVILGWNLMWPLRKTRIMTLINKLTGNTMEATKGKHFAIALPIKKV